MRMFRCRLGRLGRAIACCIWRGGGGGGGGRGGYRRRRPVRKGGNYVGIMIGAALTIIFLTWWIAVKVMKEDEPAPVAEERPRDVRGGGNGGKNIFDFPEGEK